MKKILILLTILLIVTIWSVKTKAKVNLDLQYSNITAATKTQSIFVAFDGEFRKDYSDVELKIDNELYRSREDNIVDNYRLYNDFQINYYWAKWYGLINVNSLVDKVLGIDEYSYGIGAGFNNKKFVLQGGLYNRTYVLNSFVLEVETNCYIPLADNDDIMFISENNFNKTLEHDMSVRAKSLNVLRIALAKNVNLKTGMQINYNSADTDSGINTTKRWFTGINLEF